MLVRQAGKPFVTRLANASEAFLPSLRYQLTKNSIQTMCDGEKTELWHWLLNIDVEESECQSEPRGRMSSLSARTEGISINTNRLLSFAESSHFGSASN